MSASAGEPSSAPRKSSLAAKLALTAFSVLFTLLLAEGVLRLGIWLKIDILRNGRLYAGWCDDDDYWKLHYRWSKNPKKLWDGLIVFDEDLGWTLGDEAGVEAAIGALQSGNGLKRCRDVGEVGFERYVALAVLGRNIHALGKLLLARKKPDSLAATSHRVAA